MVFLLVSVSTLEQDQVANMVNENQIVHVPSENNAGTNSRQDTTIGIQVEDVNIQRNGNSIQKSETGDAQQWFVERFMQAKREMYDMTRDLMRKREESKSIVERQLYEEMYRQFVCDYTGLVYDIRNAFTTSMMQRNIPIVTNQFVQNPR